MKLGLALAPAARGMPDIRSRKVRKILRLEARAKKLRARYEKKHSRINPWKERADELLAEARAMELTLTGGQLGELRRARGESS